MSRDARAREFPRQFDGWYLCISVALRARCAHSSPSEIYAHGGECRVQALNTVRRDGRRNCRDRINICGQTRRARSKPGLRFPAIINLVLGGAALKSRPVIRWGAGVANGLQFLNIHRGGGRVPNGAPGRSFRRPRCVRFAK